MFYIFEVIRIYLYLADLSQRNDSEKLQTKD